MSPSTFRHLMAMSALLLLPWLPRAANGFTEAEVADAGDLPATAQRTSGHGCFTAIRGGFASLQDVDVYLVQIVTPAQLVIEIACPFGNGPDLWLFDDEGRGLAANTTCSAGSKRILGTHVATAGPCYVAIARAGMVPMASGATIWGAGGVGERAPDGPGATEIVTGWADTGVVPSDAAYTVTVTGAAFMEQMPEPGPDYNGDGSVDACDEVIFASYWGADDWRANLYEDCSMSASDIWEFMWSLCTGPPKTASQGTASIGVYFDAAGTVTQLSNVAPGSLVDIYIIAKGIYDSVRAFSFVLEPSAAAFAFTDEESGAIIQLYQDVAGSGRWARGTVTGTCLEPVDGVVELARCKFFYVGDPDCTIGVRNIVRCDRPSEMPSYLACNDSCRWSYFAPASGCEAVINPVDIGNDGIADTCTCRYYQILGESDEIGWSMGLWAPQAFPEPWIFETLHQGLPAGQPASAFVTAFVDWLNTLPRVFAEVRGTDDTFYVCAPNDFQLGVGPYLTSPGCWVPPSPGCSFNPLLREVQTPASVPPAPRAFNLDNHPNPFNPRTVITFALTAPTRVSLDVYDLGGHLVRQLIAERNLDRGAHEISWDGRDSHGAPVAAGVYVCRLEAGNHSETRQLVLIK